MGQLFRQRGMVEKLGNEPESWDLEKWFQDINLELDKLASITVNEENKDIFRQFRWKWQAKQAHDPVQPEPDMGIPGNITEMNAMIDNKKYPRAKGQSDKEYTK